MQITISDCLNRACGDLKRAATAPKWEPTKKALIQNANDNIIYPYS